MITPERALPSDFETTCCDAMFAADDAFGILARDLPEQDALNLAVEPWPSKKCRHRRMPGSGSLSSLADLIQFLASDQR
jgi:hypothetical protein